MIYMNRTYLHLVTLKNSNISLEGGLSGEKLDAYWSHFYTATKLSVA